MIYWKFEDLLPTTVHHCAILQKLGTAWSAQKGHTKGLVAVGNTSARVKNILSTTHIESEKMIEACHS